MTKKKIVYLLTVLLIGSACDNDDAIIENFENPINSFSISSGDLIPAFDAHITDYHVSSLNTLIDTEITFNKRNSSTPITINGIEVKTTNYTVKLDEGDAIEISTLNDDGLPITYTVHYIPEDLPKAHTIINTNPSNGLILVNFFSFSLTNGFNPISYIAILNNNGFPTYYKRIEGRTINFKYHNLENGQKRFSYHVFETGEVTVMDGTFKTLKKLKLKPFKNRAEHPADNHDFIYFNDNHYVIPAYVERPNVDMTAYGGAANVTLIDFVFQEIRNDEVIFEWNSANFPEIFESVDAPFKEQLKTADRPVDYFHFNSMSIDPKDGNFVVSARHTNQLYKIHRTTGAIIWKMGGTTSDFDSADNAIFSHQHSAVFSPTGNLLVFDNAVNSTQQTRIIELNVDETNFKVSLENAYQKPGAFMNIMGSVQKFNNGNYVIGWGGHTNSQENASRSDITEIDSNGNILLDISFKNQDNKFTYSYRALKYDIRF